MAMKKRSAVLANKDFNLLDHFRHRGTILVILSPHAFDEVDNLWTPAISQSTERWSESARVSLSDTQPIELTYL